ncbi:MAG: hypothetical protein J7K22_04245 [Nanoarchaeota archaeon]|nr:hypothetical protein [Nanoarchaeota archaeon]
MEINIKNVPERLRGKPIVYDSKFLESEDFGDRLKIIDGKVYIPAWISLNPNMIIKTDGEKIWSNLDELMSMLYEEDKEAIKTHFVGVYAGFDGICPYLGNCGELCAHPVVKAGIPFGQLTSCNKAVDEILYELNIPLDIYLNYYTLRNWLERKK